MNEIALTVPANPDLLHLLRTVVATVAARAEYSIDEIEDLRLAVDEAGAYLLTVTPAPSQLTLKVIPNPTSITALVVSDSKTEAWPAAGAKEGLSWKVLSALSDEAEFISESGSPGVRMIKRRKVSV